MPGTLMRPPPNDPSKSPMENVIELTALSAVGPDLFTNTRELWLPPGARGVYGGAVIAQCLSAAQKTVPPPSPANGNAIFLPHSMHCYFVLAGDSAIPIIYHVERVREGRSFLTRTVQARQKGKCIFTTTISFVSEGSAGPKTLDHGWEMPLGVKEALEEMLKTGTLVQDKEAARNGINPSGPFISKRLGIYNYDSPFPHARRPQSWLKCHGEISGGLSEHLSALAYMSDSWFVGTSIRVHKLQGLPDEARRDSPQTQSSRAASEMAEEGHWPTQDIPMNTKPTPASAQVGMMVSLDHTIYFHRPREIKADEWLFSEMQSPWMGEGRAFVTQRIWNREGRLLATCVQEGLVRLKQDDDAGTGSSKL